MKLSTKLTFLAIAITGITSTQATVLTNYEDWTVDRAAPNGFSNIGDLHDRSDVLEVAIAEVDVRGDTFNNNQGRGLALTSLPADYSVIHGSLFVPSGWATGTDADTFRSTALWGFAVNNAANTPSNAHFPIVGFANSGGDASGDTTPGTGRIRVWDSNSGWMPNANQPVKYDAWNDVCMVLANDSIQTYVNGSLAHTQSDIDLAGVNADSFNRLVVNTFNYGADYSSHWSNIGAGTLSTVAISGSSEMSAPAGSAFEDPLLVEARDSDGSPLPCVPVTFTAPASGASTSVAASTIFTDYMGRAAFPAMANGSVGTYAVSVSAPGVQDQVTFNLTNIPAVSSENIAPVPTLSQWSIIVTMMLLAGFGIFRLRRTK